MADTDLYLLRFSGEVATKARRTRQRFTDRIVAAVEDGLASAGIEYRLEREWSRLFVHSADRRAPERLRRVFGLQSLSPAVVRPWGALDDIVAAGAEVFAPEVRGRRFAVRARRTTGRESQAFTSPDVERALGAALVDGAAGVDLEHPEVTAGVEVHDDTVYFFARSLAAPGGLPLGVEGRALALVSGGYDSAVASWEAWKRGVGLDFVFFDLGGAAHVDGARRVVERLAGDWAYGDWPRLFTIDLKPLVEQLRGAVKPRYWQLVLKALMYQAADLLADELSLPALFTGEALGQVSSQTLPNLALLDRVVARPVLRPLLTWNKETIVAAARAIGTAELSAAVPEFCALAAHQATTHAHRGAFARALAQLDAAAVPRAVAGRTVSEPRLRSDLPASPGALTVDRLPPAATVLDLRSPEEFAHWHWPGAVNLEYFAALRVYRSIDRRRQYVLYCDVGLKSAHLAELMRAAGVSAHHLPAGAAALRRAAEGSGRSRGATP